MEPSPIRVLIVDDNEPWRHLFCSILGDEPGLQVIGEASDGLEAVQKVEALRPDLILLDIGLPTLNGIEAARRIRQISPVSRILFVSENRSADVAKEALSTGACGYVLKSDAARQLLLAVSAVLTGKCFVSPTLVGHATYPQSPHEVEFYSEDRHLLDAIARFIAAALTAGNSAIVVATKPHLESLVLELETRGFDMRAAIEERRYIPLDAAGTLSMFMVNDRPDPTKFLELWGDLIIQAREAAKGENPCVSVFGEGVQVLWERGNADAAIQVEQLCNKLTQIHAVDILCGYSLENVDVAMDAQTYQQICSEHSAVHSS